MSDLIKRLRSIRGNFVIPTDSPPIFKWADEAADALERIQDTFCVWEDCDQEASYCEGHAHELVNPLGLQYAPPALEVIDGVMSDKSQDADWLRARYFEGITRIEELEAALEILARLGNGDKYGNSDGNIIAQKALEKQEPSNE